MSCGCGGRSAEGKKVDSPERIAPDDPCVFCSYKHFHTARRLSEEPFYTAKNRGDIEGELVLSQWHLWKLNRMDLCMALRDIRHKVERFKEREIDWTPSISAFDEILIEEKSKNTTEENK